MLFDLLSMAPILLLILLSLLWGIRPAVWLSFLLTAGLFFFWGSGFERFGAVLLSSLVSALPILMIVLGALLFFQIMEISGYLARITQTLRSISDNATIRFFLLAMGFTAFFEGVAGFGTPGALVPPLLVSMGYPVITSVAIVLLFDGVFAVFGALGTPLLGGLQPLLMLPQDQLMEVGRLASYGMAPIGLLVCMAAMVLFRSAQKPVSLPWPKVLLMYGLYLVGMMLGAQFSLELPSVLGGLLLLAGTILLFRQKGAQLSWKEWMPYIGLVLVLLLPKLSLPLSDLLSFRLGLEEIGDTGIPANFQPLRSPFFPFLLLGLLLWLATGRPRLALKPLSQKTVRVFLVLFPSIALSKCMLYSDAVRPSMVSHIAELFSGMGSVYPAFAGTIGAIGTFITGSSTVSNILFGASQWSTAEQLGLDPVYVASLQHLGSSLGNAICLFNIIAAAAVVGVDRPQAILAKVLLPIVLCLIGLGLLGLWWV